MPVVIIILFLIFLYFHPCLGVFMLIAYLFARKVLSDK
jgi:hypothetical protein